MTITAEEIYQLNKMNMTAQRVQLGTLIANAESVVAAEIALANGSILIGNGSGVAAANVVTGDVVISNVGVTSISAGVILNADVNAAAAIAVSKLAAVTASKALQSDASGFISASAVSSTELGYVAGVTSAIQTQVDGMAKLAGRSGGQIIYGGTAASETLSLVSTSDATKGNITIGGGFNVAQASTTTTLISGWTLSFQNSTNTKFANFSLPTATNDSIAYSLPKDAPDAFGTMTVKSDGVMSLSETSHVVFKAGVVALTNNATQSITVTGAAPGDVVFVQLAASAGAETILYAVANNNAIDITLSGAPGTPNVNYQVLKAVV